MEFTLYKGGRIRLRAAASYSPIVAHEKRYITLSVYAAMEAPAAHFTRAGQGVRTTEVLQERCEVPAGTSRGEQEARMRFMCEIVATRAERDYVLVGPISTRPPLNLKEITKQWSDMEAYCANDVEMTQIMKERMNGF